MKKSTVNTIIRLVPNTPTAKKLLTKARISRIRSHYIPEAEITAGEADYEVRRRLVEKYRVSRSKELVSTEKGLKHLLDHAPAYQNRQDLDRLVTDILFCRLAYGFQPDEFLCFGLENQTQQERLAWISDLDRYQLIHAMNDVKDVQIFNNKARTYDMFRDQYGREAISVQRESDWDAFERFVSAHREFVKKQVDEGMGRSIELVRTAEIEPRSYFRSLIAKGEHILEERIVQSSVMSALNASSVNTVRCITVCTRDGMVVPYTFLKVGRSGSFVDNGGAGGILAGIDAQTGEIVTHGYDEFSTEYISHPDSGIPFQGYRFPLWDEMKAMCCDMSAKIPSVKCIGWDLALTDRGWVVVEGNGMTQFIGPQIVFKRGIKQEVLQILERVDIIAPIV